MENEETTFDGEDSGLVRDLRRQLKEALKLNKQFEEELSEFRSKARASDIGDLLESNGVSRKVAKFVPNDLEDDEVVSWLEENRELFGAVSSGSTDGEAQGSVSPEVSREQVRANELTAAAASPDKIADLEAKIQNAESEEEINDILSEFQSYQL